MRMLNRVASEGVDPKTTGVKLPMDLGVLTIISGGDRCCGQLTGTKSVRNSLTRKRLNHASGIADQE